MFYASEKLCAEYGGVKLALAAEPDMDIDTYIARKSAVLQKILAESDLTADERAFRSCASTTQTPELIDLEP